VGAASGTTIERPGGLGREILLMVLGLLVVAFAATVLFREPARSSPQGTRPATTFGAN
jgi:hypothetical protein